MIESEMGYRGSKSIVKAQPRQNIIVKEQRVDGGYIKNILMLRYTLMGLERGYQGRILSNRLNSNLKRLYSTKAVLDYKQLSPNYTMRALNPWFISGFVDGEGCFRISFTKKDNLVGWRAQLFFQITLHRKDELLLESIKNYWGVGKVYKSGKDTLQYKIQSFTEIETILNHFDKLVKSVQTMNYLKMHIILF